MSTDLIIFSVAFLLLFIGCILFVIFGQITVRKLRKNPETKDALGMELYSGWDIFNVAQALALPRSWSRRIDKNPLSSFFNGDTEKIHKHTTRFDKILAILFYWMFITSTLIMMMLAILDALGVFE